MKYTIVRTYIDEIEGTPYKKFLTMKNRSIAFAVFYNEYEKIGKTFNFPMIVDVDLYVGNYPIKKYSNKFKRVYNLEKIKNKI